MCDSSYERIRDHNRNFLWNEIATHVLFEMCDMQVHNGRCYQVGCTRTRDHSLLQLYVSSGDDEGIVLILGYKISFPWLDLWADCSGPLLKKIGWTPEKVGQQVDEWLTLGVKLSRQLKFDEFALSQSEKVRIYHYYVPVFLWCKRQLDIHTSKFKPGEPVPALVVSSLGFHCNKLRHG